MAIIKCPECNKEISDTAKTCIHCGYKIKGIKTIHTYKFVKKIRPIIIVLLIILGPIWLLLAILNRQLWDETMEYYFNTIPRYDCGQYAYNLNGGNSYLYDCNINNENACFECRKDGFLFFSRVHGCVLKTKTSCQEYIKK